MSFARMRCAPPKPWTMVVMVSVRSLQTIYYLFHPCPEPGIGDHGIEST